MTRQDIRRRRRGIQPDKPAATKPPKKQPVKPAATIKPPAKAGKSKKATTPAPTNAEPSAKAGAGQVAGAGNSKETGE